MKRHASKLLRSTSKARAWYGFALLFGVGIFLFPTFAQAALTSPVPVVSGSGYGQADSLGLRHSSNQVFDQDGIAWEFEQTQHRKLVYVTPQTGKELLVAAVLNKTGQGTCVDTASIQTCRLEFRVSSDGGTTWAQALVGTTPYLPIVGIKGSGGTKFDYALYVSPSSYGSAYSQDIWVSYTYATIVEEGQLFTRSKIQKLVYNNALAWTLDPVLLASEPVSFCDSTKPYIQNCHGETGVGVQMLPNGSQRVWGLARKYCNNFVECNYPYKVTVLVYSDNFNTGSATWNESSSYGSYYGFGPLRRLFGSMPRATFVPVGAKKIPTLVTVSALQMYNCETRSPERTTSIMTLKNEQSTIWTNLAVGSAYPFYYSFAATFNGGDFHCPGNLREALINPYNNNNQWSYELAFSAASVIDPAEAYKSRVVIASSGGSNDVYADNRLKILASSCTVTIAVSEPSTSSIVCPITTKEILNGYDAPSVGYYNGHFWISAKDSTKKLKIFSETTPFTPPTWTWAEELGNTYSNTIASPSAVDFIPIASAVVTNSTYIPTIFSDLGGNRVAFDANAGGTTIGTNPPYTSNPVWGYGWSPNFGFLSLNCINKPDSGHNCDANYGNGLFGLGIGSTADAAPDATKLPDIRSGTTNILSPTSLTTFPIGGYGWSSNAGFLSLERRDSVCDTTAPTNPCTGGEDNGYGNPPGAAYHNAGASFDQNVPMAKYDTTSQRAYGWGRFLNLCNYDYTNKRCLDKDNGWVRLRGYYLTAAAPYSIRLTSQTAFTITDGIYNCSDFFDADAPNTQVFAIDQNYVFVASCSGTAGTLNALTPFPAASFPYDTTIKDVTNKEYGLDAYWTGDHYELAGWAWSYDYGWVRFKPLIFLGYAWLETLFGNIYSGGSITLPNPQRSNGEQITKCGKDTSVPADGIGDEPCFTATYQIEANGGLTEFSYPGYDATLYPASSALGFLNGVGCDYSGTPTGLCANILGNTTAQTAIQQMLRRTASYPLSNPFPSVSPGATTYRNVLGKIDIGSLANPPSNVTVTTSTGAVSSHPSFTAAKTTNRKGDELFIYGTDPNDASSWTAGLISGSTWWGGASQCDGSTTCHFGMQKANHQVVHVQGDLIVGVDQSGGEMLMNTTLSAFVRNDTVGGSATLGNASSFPQQNSTFVVDMGTGNEEYFSYTSRTGNNFTGVKSISGAKTHTAGGATPSTVRWAWRLPYTVCTSTPCRAQSATVIVDGDLKIQYNIITADPRNDADISPKLDNTKSIRDLPTLAFIVAGNVVVDPHVSTLTGAYIVTSKNTASATGTDNGGVFSTGNDYALCNQQTKICNPLKVTGMLMARLFSFDRFGNLNLDAPGEQVKADERLYLNPPPGLEDATKALPNPQQTSP